MQFQFSTENMAAPIDTMVAAFIIASGYV